MKPVSERCCIEGSVEKRVVHYINGNEGEVEEQVKWASFEIKAMLVPHPTAV